MCHPDSCHGNRCCCQAVEMSSLVYYCPNERGVLVPNIVERCDCAPCDGIPVVFVGMVTDTENTPIPYATVIVDSNDTYYANDDSIFGFSISSSQDTVVVMVTAMGYWDYIRLLGVTPGEVNILQVQMTRQLIQTLPPSPYPLLINIINLAVFHLTSDDDDLLPLLTPQEEGGGVVQSFIEFPEGLFTEISTLIGQPVALDNPANLQNIGMSFVTFTEPQTRKRKGTEWRHDKGVWLDEGMGRRRRREDEGMREMNIVFVVSMGLLDIINEEGNRMNDMANLIIHTFFTNYSCTDLIPFQIYLITDMELNPVENVGNSMCIEEEDHTHLINPLPPNISLPITYVLGTSDPITCYIAVRVFQMMSSGDVMDITTTVWIYTSTSGQRVNVMYGESNECVPIPCHGDLSVWILDGLQYTPEYYNIVLFEDDVIITSNDVMLNQGVVFDNMLECETTALGDMANPIM